MYRRVYADDIALISPDEGIIAKLFDFIVECFREWRLSVNDDNTQVLNFQHK